MCVWPSLVSRLHHLHLFTELWQVSPHQGNTPCVHALHSGACLAAFYFYRSQQWAWSCSHQLPLCLWLSCLCSLILHLHLFFYSSCSFFMFALCLSPSASRLLSPGVELNLGRLTVTEWLMCRFCQLCPNKHKPFCAGWEPVSIWIFRWFFIILCTNSPSQFMCSALTKNWAVIMLAQLQMVCLF